MILKGREMFLMVGDILRQERERQNFSLKDIEQGTSIRALYIESIENGNYDKLPGNVYTKGFIKNYANFLKLDGDALSRQFMEEIAPPPVAVVTETAGQQQPTQTQSTQTQPPQIQTPNSQTTIKEETNIINEPIPDINNQRVSEPEINVITSRRVREERTSNSSINLIIIAVVLIAAIAGSLWYYFTQIEGSEISQNPPAQTQTTDPSETSASASTTNNASQVNNNVLDLQVKFSDRCWIRVLVDGNFAYEGIAEKGQTLSWQATNDIYVSVGNAGAIEFIENGKSLGKAGGFGEVIEKTFVRHR